jgi:hypothetical protein
MQPRQTVLSSYELLGLAMRLLGEGRLKYFSEAAGGRVNKQVGAHSVQKLHEALYTVPLHGQRFQYRLVVALQGL